ncbi:DUF1294 domain-containing protein [Lysobacter koreensis]|uniref:DUF1294 domain-containing protein n=1 Tax=Lysobacter koreensis TaxID=266122 RepID=A0ABW2YNA8_9GAMM
MEQLGKVQAWHDDKGYGFIAALGDASAGDRVFFHIRDYERAGRRPQIGELVRYRPARRADGRPRADWVRRAVQAKRPAPRTTAGTHRVAPAREIPTPVALPLIAAYAAAIAWAIQVERLPTLAAFVLAGLSVAAYIAYAIDKHAAQNGRWRVAESTLHGLEMLGGWPGALLAQRVMRHKTRKARYRVGFWLAVAVNCAALGWWVLWR